MRSLRLVLPCTAVLAALSGFAVYPGSLEVTAQQPSSNDPPPTLVLQGTIRDFKKKSETGGHVDFENIAVTGTGGVQRIVKDQLGADGKPVFRSKGVFVRTMAKDALGNQMLSGKTYLKSLPGDVAATFTNAASNLVNSEASFDQWFRDVPGVNMSMPLNITLNYNPSTQTYVFDDRTDPTYKSLGGFFPINGQLFGNTAGETKNYHFTFELHTLFTYHAGKSQRFTFNGDDDVWVFIDGKLVIDLGGIHSRQIQTIDLDRIIGLEDKKNYTLDIFFAERNRTQSNFRMETNMALQSAGIVPKRVVNWMETEPEN